jgi:isoleucyl-tRNA synthetase
VRQIARKTALEAIDAQKMEMKDIGVMADWDSETGTYRTMGTPVYVEANLSSGFRDPSDEIICSVGRKRWDHRSAALTTGLVTHRLRPVYYSPSSRTALAEAELKYKDIQSRSVYVAFPVSTYPDVIKAYSDVHLAIWTTTPWTLPANMVSPPRSR